MAAFVGAPGLPLSQSRHSSFCGVAPVRRAASPAIAARRCLPTRYHVSPSATAAQSSVNPATDEIVDDLLDLVRDTDSGKTVTDAESREIADKVGQLNRYNGNRPLLEDPTIFDNYNVAYSRSRQLTQPAGGMFRSKIGSMIFRTSGLFQHVIRPNLVVNAVSFRFLGIISGVVVLRGKIESLKDREPGLGPNAIAVDFERPRIKLGPATFQYGPLTRVRLTLCHLDKRVRLGIGRRGTILIFTRCEEGQAHVDDWMSAVNAKPWPTILLPAFAVGVLAFSIFAPLVIRLGVLVVLAMVFFVLRNAGNASSRPDGYRDRVINDTAKAAN